MENRSFAMNGGEGPRSCAQNSSFQRSAFEAQKRLIDEAIANNFDHTMITATSASNKNLITIADLGCSTGPNTFIAIHNITQAIKNHYYHHTHKPLSHDQETLEFQVFFNDQVSNDFNTLFKNIPSNRSYFACGVAGSFRGRLFPKQSLHFVHSASTLHWLSRVPKDIEDRSNCRAWNKGRIHHIDAPKEVGEAYEAQFKEDLVNFLNARAEEVVGNGLMALQLPAAPDVAVDDEGIDPATVFELLGSSLMDMARVGIMKEEKVDSFNLPIFYSPIKSVKAIVEENEHFSVEKMEALNLENFYSVPNVYTFVSVYRVVMEDLITKHFGGAIVDELFDRFTQKVLEFPDIMNPRKLKIVMLFVLLKRKM